MLPSKALERARELVASGWCQGADARAANGAPVESRDARARSWSLLGALTAVVDGAENRGVLEQVGTSALALAVAGRPEGLKDWNDDPRRRHDEVVGAYDVAIALLPPPAATRARAMPPRRSRLRAG